MLAIGLRKRREKSAINNDEYGLLKNIDTHSVFRPAMASSTG
ncbi:MAG: hypothetical protein ACLR17_03455 [Enterobacteriaceae bacterium]